MQYKATLDLGIPKGSKIVIPISLNQPYCQGERLKALIEFSKNYDATFVIADTLHRHNTNEEEALAQGTRFLDENPELKGLKFKRWNDFILKEQKEFLEKLAL